MKTFCLASSNPNKIIELKKMLGADFEIKSLQDIGCVEEIKETELSLEGNSKLKASYVFEKYDLNCIADDSGLEVESLKGEPGVFSARYAGEHGNHEKNMAKLLAKLRNVSNRNAQFRTVITLIKEGVKTQFEGVVKGKISITKKGKNGFGYDPIFVPDGYKKTFAEMTLVEKIPISHRGKAMEKLLKYLKGQ